MRKFISNINKNNILLYTIPIFVIFFIALLAYYPGIVTYDGLDQWNMIKTGYITDWHPAYNTLYLLWLSEIWATPFLPVLIECIVLSFSIGFFLSKLDKYYHINKWYLLVCAILLAILPLNLNSAVILLKDTLYLAFVIILSSFVLDFANDKNYFDKTSNCVWFSIIILFICLTRHNGIYATILFDIVMFIVFKKNKKYIVSSLITIGVFFLMTTVGFSIMNIERGNIDNKYAPVSDLLTRIIIENKESITSEEYRTISKYYDIDAAVEHFNQYNMDMIVFDQYPSEIRNNQKEYLTTALKIFARNPKLVFKHYKYLNHFLYSPIGVEGDLSVAMFTKTNNRLFKGLYPEVEEDSKIKWLLPKLKKYCDTFKVGIGQTIFMRPAIYMYSIIVLSFVFSRIYKNKLLLFLSLFIICNTLILAIAMPLPMTRYVSSTILLGQLMILWFIYEVVRNCVTKKKK